MACSGGFRTMDLLLISAVSATKIWHFPPLGFWFLFLPFFPSLAGKLGKP